MIASLRGTLIYNDANSCVVECGGVGYSCFLTAKALGKLPQKGEEVFLNTHMVVKEDAFELYGFVDREEMECLLPIVTYHPFLPDKEKKRKAATGNHRSSGFILAA